MARAEEYEAFLSGLMTGQVSAADPPPEPVEEPKTDDNVRIGDTVQFVPSRPVEVEEIAPPPGRVQWPADFAKWLAANGS